MTRRIAWLNEKGGSGKSTSALNLSANLASRFGQRVLLIDVDHQANITAVLTQGEVGKYTLTDVLLKDVPAEQALFHTHLPTLDLLAADSELADVNVAMADSGSRLGLGRELRLKRALAAIEGNYDFVIVDTGPQRTLLNINVLNYVDEVFVPIDPGYDTPQIAIELGTPLLPHDGGQSRPLNVAFRPDASSEARRFQAVTQLVAG